MENIEEKDQAAEATAIEPVKFIFDQDYLDQLEAEAVEKAHKEKIARRAAMVKKLAGMERFRARTLKPFYEAYNRLIDELHEEFGTGEYFQDADGVVYKTTVPNGTFVEFRTRGIARTRFEDEAKGSLSSKEAKEAGFEPANAERRTSKPKEYAPVGEGEAQQ